MRMIFMKKHFSAPKVFIYLFIEFITCENSYHGLFVDEESIT